MSIQLSQWQIELINSYPKTFGDDWRVEVLVEHDSEGKWLKSGRVFMHVNTSNRYYDYPADIGWFEDAYAVRDAILLFLSRPINRRVEWESL